MIKKRILKSLIQEYDLEGVEKHLIYQFLLYTKLNFEKSPILSSYFAVFVENPQLSSLLTELEITSLKTLESYLELLIPQKDRKLNGAYFTPAYIVDYIINELKPMQNDKNVDLACGCGAFLLGLVHYYQSNFDKSVKAIIKENIYGYDILAYNIKRTKLLLSIYALQQGEILIESDFNLITQDSLKKNWVNKFDIVIGNPPYIKFQDLSDEYRNFLSKGWKTIQSGSFNLYFAFFELGYHILKPTGRLGYITPNNYFTSLSGQSLRNFFHAKQCVSKIIDFTHHKIFDAQTYTALTFLNKKNNEAIMFDRITDPYSPEDFLKVVKETPNYLKDQSTKKWRLLKNKEHEIINTIESIGTPLKELFDISAGIATLKDDIFFVDSSQECDRYYIKRSNEKSFKIEKEITRPVYKVSEIRSQEEIPYNTKRIICPYTFEGNSAKPIPETEFKKKYPNCYAYLLSQKEVLTSRDKGKVTYNPFYVWGRTQGLVRRGQKILTPTFSRRPRFMLVAEENAFFTNGYGIYPKPHNGTTSASFKIANIVGEIANFDVARKILNSNLMHYYVSKTSVAIEGGYPCYQKNFIEKFSIPPFSENEINKLRKLECPKKIDLFLLEKYQLNMPAPNLCS